MDIQTEELMEIVYKLKSGEEDADEILADLSLEDRERLEIIVVEADGTMQAVEPIDYSRFGM